MAEVQVEAVRKAVHEHCPAGMDAEVKDYLAETVVSLFEDGAEADAEALRPELQSVAGPLLEDYDVTDKDAEDFCERILKAGFNGVAVKGATAKLSADAGACARAECMCHIPNLLLMYGGSPQPLLKNATLELLRGGRYGIVGANGTGKTTLMARLATKDIVGFPQDVRVVHLRHEAILRGVAPSISALDYALRHEGGGEELSAALQASLLEVGFDGDDMLGKAVGALSGGWQMRLALACALAKRANLLLLDEPTNHLDTVAVDWLVEFVNRTCSARGNEDCTALIVSHDADFLNRVCTHIVHFTPDASLAYHKGSFDTFKATVLSGDEAKAQQLLEVGSKSGSADEDLPWGASALTASLSFVDKLVFPNPEKIPGQPSEVLALRNVTFQHEGAESPVLNNLDLHLASNSRVAIVGRNGSGKSTLLSLLAGRLEPCKGEIWSHPHLRLVYIAQHHESQLKSFLANTPMEYMQLRFKRGYDLEAMTPRLEKTEITQNQARRNRELAKKLGKRGAEPEAVVSRQFVGKDGRDAVYEVKWQGLTPADNSFEKRSRLKSLGVEYMANEYDEMMAIAWGSSPERPLTDKELHGHLGDFGLPQEVTTKRQISMLSSGQRSKLMFAASFWTRPHIVCLDEPTNYLDSDTVEQLQKALRNFRGGFVVVSHSESFVADVANEIWTAAAGAVTAAPVALG